MARFKISVVKKRHLKNKRTYQCACISLRTPRKFHEIIKPFFKRDLEMKVNLQNGKITIDLTPKTLPKPGHNSV